MDLDEDITVDLVEGLKNVKVTLIGVYARPQARKYRVLNEICSEEEVGTYILNTDIV